MKFFWEIKATSRRNLGENSPLKNVTCDTNMTLMLMSVNILTVAWT